MSENKIVYFDYWTVGISNFKFFDQNLKDNGFETKLIHLNSWKGIDGPKYERLHNIDCYDIRFFGTNLLYEILKKEKPLAVIMLNSSFITDRTIIVTCKKLKIKVIYLAHGSLPREEFVEQTIKTLNQSIKKNRFNRAIKHIKGTVVNYLYSIIRYDWRYLFKWHAYNVIIKTFFNPAKYLLFPPPAFDIEPDLTLVYGNAEKDFYIKRLTNTESIKVIGIPDLDKYFQEIESLGNDRDLFYETNNIPKDKRYITYLEEGLVQDKAWTNEYSLSFFATISQFCKEAGFHLVIKLHPRTAKSKYRSSFNSLSDVTIIEQVNFPKLIYFSDKCISHFSTTFIYPILLNKPILIPRWGKSGELLPLHSPREVTYVHTLQEFQRFLKIRDFDYDRSEFLKNFVPFTDGKTSERISKHVIDLIRERI